MPKVIRKRPSSVAPTEEQGKKTTSRTKRRKKLEEEKCQENVESDISKNDSGLASLSTSLNNVESNSGMTTPLKKAKSQPKQKKGTFEKPTLPPKMIENMNISELLAIGENSGNADYNKSSSELEDFSDSGMSDFEEVKSESRDEPVVPKDGVNITLNVPDLHKRGRNRGVDLEAHLKRQLNRVKKDLQLLMHKVHLLCWIAHLKFVNNVLNDPSLMEGSLKLVTSKNLYPSKYADLTYLEGILKWFHKTIQLKKCLEEPAHSDGLLKELLSDFENKHTCTNKNFILMFIVILRVLGLKTRVVISFQVLPVRPTLFELNDKGTSQDKRKSKEEQKDNHEEASGNKKNKNTEPVVSANDKDSNQSSQNKVKGKRRSAMSSKSSGSGYFDQSDDSELENFKVSKKGSGSKSNSGRKPNSYQKTKNKKELNSKLKTEGNKTPCKNDKSDSSDNEDNFTPQSLKKSRKSIKKPTSSTEESATVKKKEGCDIWTEVYLEAEEKWISVDVCRQKIHCISELYSRATHPVLYVIACNNDSTLKDVTKRYVPSWHSETRKKRVDEVWWNETMKPYLPPNTAQNKEEDEDITRQLSDKPLPSAISEFKDHPLYALKRHLLKFEAIYPPDAPTLGFIRGEPVYARECVVTLHSREMWYKQARVVRLKEEPYKIVKARPKYDRMTGEVKKDIPLELFGFWQTEEYIPPIAVDGKVPRNEYGNVDLFKPSMLPIGTVHLQIPALNRVAKKLGIDCAPATVGFEFHSGGSHPVFDGFVVCEEFKEILLDNWNKEIDESAKKNEEKREKRVYGNWKRLIRGLLIREKLKIKYAFGENSDEENTSAASSCRASTSKS